MAHRCIMLGKIAWDMVSLSLVLKVRIESEPDLNLLCAAEAGLPYEAVVELLDTIRGAGVKRVGLEVRSKPPSRR